MKKFALLAATLAVLLTASSAFAFSLGGYLGPVELKFAGYGMHEGVGVIGDETWGIFKLTSIQTPGGASQLWSSLSSGEEIYGMFYGLEDTAYIPSGDGYSILQSGGSFDMYLKGGTHTGEFNTGLGGSGRIGTDGYDTITNIPGSTLFLSGDFAPGIITGDSTTTVRQTVLDITSPTTGTGSGYADVDGGAYLAMFDSNGLNGHDMLFRFNVDEPVDNTLTTPNESLLWSQSINDPVRANAVPEPASMVLLGIGLAGVAVSRRKKVA